MNLWEKLIEVRKLVTYLQKANQSTQFAYVSSSQVLSAVREKMDDLGLILKPEVIGHKVSENPIEQVNGDGFVTKRTITYFTEVDMLYTWVNAEKPEERETSTWYAQGVDIAGEKGVGKAYTYGEKYFILKYFQIATDKDDPDAFHNQPDQPKSAKAPSTPYKPQTSANAPSQPSAPKPQAGTNTGTGELITKGQAGYLISVSREVGYKDTDADELFLALSDLTRRTINNWESILKSEKPAVEAWLKQQKQ